MSARPKEDEDFSYLDEKDERGRPRYYGHQRIEPLRERDCGPLEIWRSRIRLAHAMGARREFLRLSLMLSAAMAGQQLLAQKAEQKMARARETALPREAGLQREAAPQREAA